MNLPIRKSIRLKNYDYSSSGYYFITICTQNKRKILCDIVGDGVYDIPKTKLTEYGKCVYKYINKMDDIDYGNVIDCIAACAIAGAAAADNHKRGGIAGFQAGYVMWQFIRNYMYKHNKCGLRMIDWDNMLYYQDKALFDKNIPQNVFERLQNQAKEEIQIKRLSEKQKQHLQNIIDGIPPFGYSIKPEE